MTTLHTLLHPTLTLLLLALAGCTSSTSTPAPAETPNNANADSDGIVRPGEIHVEATSFALQRAASSEGDDGLLRR